jgi:hypothetical protein
LEELREMLTKSEESFQIHITTHSTKEEKIMIDLVKSYREHQMLNTVQPNDEKILLSTLATMLGCDSTVNPATCKKLIDFFNEETERQRVRTLLRNKSED